MLEATGEVLVQHLYIYATAEMLSHQIATLVCIRLSTACSSAIQCINIPINLRSYIDIQPVGFVVEHNSSPISLGHSRYHINGGRVCLPENHTPPTPHLEASTRPW